MASWGWLLDELGYKPFGDWPGGRSWRAGHTYIVLEQSPDRTASRHDRCRPGLNHLAFHVADQEQVEKLVAVAPSNGWRLMFADRHPYAGGEGHYAAYLENADGFEVELVAPTRRRVARADGPPDRPVGQPTRLPFRPVHDLRLAGAAARLAGCQVRRGRSAPAPTAAGPVMTSRRGP